MPIARLSAPALVVGILSGPALATCAARDFLALPLPEQAGRPAAAIALELAYPAVTVHARDRSVAVSGRVLPLGDDRARSARARLADPSMIEQFSQIYPLDFDPADRTVPWFDPGRARNDAFFRALYGDSEAEVAAQLVTVAYHGAGLSARFRVTRRHCVAEQLDAALAAIAAEGASMDRFFTEVGGSFTWRRIAGTTRLSTHSFGIAVDFNTRLGGYWRWSGAAEGAVGPIEHGYPEALVRHMESFGFIWGGKWHHFDGMHFEYRPELILHARLLGDG